MNFKTLLKMFFLHFAVIYGLSMMVTLIWTACVAPEGRFGVDFLWKMLLFSLGADLPLFIFYSRKELSAKQSLLRMAIHAVLLEVILLPAGYFIGLWGGVGGFFIFFFVVLAVDAAVIALTFLNCKAEADEINAAIKARKLEITEERDDDGESN